MDNRVVLVNFRKEKILKASACTKHDCAACMQDQKKLCDVIDLTLAWLLKRPCGKPCIGVKSKLVLLRQAIDQAATRPHNE
jgi:hypothetical protein